MEWTTELRYKRYEDWTEEENHRRLTLILEQLDDRIKTVRGELGEKQKIYATVSMVMGGMLVILLI